jgi:hypothetical protein
MELMIIFFWLFYWLFYWLFLTFGTAE